MLVSLKKNSLDNNFEEDVNNFVTTLNICLIS